MVTPDQVRRRVIVAVPVLTVLLGVLLTAQSGALAVVAFLALYAIIVGIGVAVGRDAQRHGRDGWIWGAVFVFQPVICGIAYLIVRNKPVSQSYVSSFRTAELPEVTPKPGDVKSTSVPTSGFVYSVPTLRGLALIPLFIMIFVALGVIVPGLKSGSNDGLLVFAVFFLGAGCWVTYGFWFRVPYELVLKNDVILWRTLARSGSASIAEICSVSPYQWGSNAAMIRFDSGRKLIVMIQSGFSAFADELQQRVRPGVLVEVNRFGRWLGQ